MVIIRQHDGFIKCFIRHQGDHRAKSKLGMTYFFLGARYSEGTEVPRNDLKAYAFFLRAEANGIIEAKRAQSELEQTMSSDQLTEAIRLAKGNSPIPR